MSRVIGWFSPCPQEPVGPVPSFFEKCPPTLEKRRSKIPAKPNHRVNLWSIMKNCIGKDLSRIPMPVRLSLTPSHPHILHTLLSSHPHTDSQHSSTLTSSHSHILTPSHLHPRQLISSYPHILTLSRPHLALSHPHILTYSHTLSPPHTLPRSISSSRRPFCSVWLSTSSTPTS